MGRLGVALMAFAVGAFMLTLSLSPVFAGEEAKGGQEVTITGEVVDPACYIAMGMKGEAHKECAIACAKAGQAFAILAEDGTLYQVIEGAPGADPNKLLWDHAESKVTVKGKLFEKGGMKAIVPAEVTSAG